MIESFYSIRSEHLSNLSPGEAVAIFRDLLLAEATTLGISGVHVDVPSEIYASDGGIDAEVKDAISLGQDSGIIFPGTTRYQIKTGPFAMDLPHVRKILFRDGTADIKPRIKDCLDRSGTLIVVLFGWDVPEAKPGQHLGKFRVALAKWPEYEKSHIAIIRQNQLISLLERYRALALRINGRFVTGSPYQWHESWEENADMSGDSKEGSHEFKIGPAQQKFLIALQTALRNNTQAVHVHVCGEPGIGKTRLVLEATRADDLRPLVVYCPDATRFSSSPLLQLLLDNHDPSEVLLVLDECPPATRTQIWNLLRNRGRHLRLVTIYNERETATGTTRLLDAPRLQDGQVSAIIQSYDVDSITANRYAAYCDGSPRVAHVLGRNLKYHPDDLLHPGDFDLIWERYIADTDDLRSESFELRMLVLKHLSLFKRFEFGEDSAPDMRILASWLQESDHRLTWYRFLEIVQRLKRRKVLQGEYVLYITPKLLHIKLWRDWWDIYGRSGFEVEPFAKRLSASLLDGFYDMFRYASESEVATKVVYRLLSDEGPFRDGSRLKNAVDARFFLALTEADPRSALVRLTKTLGTWPRSELLGFTTGRREIVAALHRMALWAPLFAGAAKLLLALAEAENEPWSNNATGIFAGLFSPGYDRLAQTEASPEERFPILKETLRSASSVRRKVALSACSAALAYLHLERTVGPEWQGLRREPQWWHPRNYGELFDAYRRVWQLIRQELPNLPRDEQTQAITVLLQRGRELVRIANLADMVVDTYLWLFATGVAEAAIVLRETLLILRFEGSQLEPETRSRFEALRDHLTGTAFASRLRRYVCVGLEQQIEDDSSQVERQLDQLASEALSELTLLKPELGWLVTNQAQEGFRFGYALSRHDVPLKVLPLLLDAQRGVGEDRSAFFLSGYLRGVKERSLNEWAAALDVLEADQALERYVGEVIWRSGSELTEHDGDRILRLARRGVLGIRDFKLFVFGRSIDSLGESVFRGWIEAVLESKDPFAASVALALFHAYYVRESSRSRTLPKELTLRVLTHPALMGDEQERVLDVMDEYHWSEVVNVVIDHDEDLSHRLLKTVVEHFGLSGSITEHANPVASAGLDVYAQKFAVRLWTYIEPLIGPPIDQRAYSLREWMREHLPLFPPEAIWQWVSGDVDERAWYVASFVPKALFRSADSICWARELLIRYGDRQEVRTELSANMASGTWHGPLSLHYLEERRRIAQFREGEGNHNVLTWVDEYITSLDESIQRAKLMEERMGL